MKAKLLYHTPLEILVLAARTCTATTDKMDCDGDNISDDDKRLISNVLLKQSVSETVVDNICDYVTDVFMSDYLSSGVPDCNDLRFRVQSEIDRLREPKHDSVLEHVNYSFRLKFSRALLQELSRHRHASESVQSTRYALKKVINAGNCSYMTGDCAVDFYTAEAMKTVIGMVKKKMSNDIVKYVLPESFMTENVYTINARSLRNLLYLRTHSKALKEFRDLGMAMYEELPEEHRFLYSDVMWEDSSGKY